MTHNYLVISDLHLSEGRDPLTGKLSPNEDFFFDDEFARFLVYHMQLAEDAALDPAYHKPWRLIINGDFLDFLQVTTLPDEDHPLFTKYGVEMTPNKERYGLGTSEPETVWKLKRIVEGHPVFFQALGWFLAHPDNDLIIIKGNHDIEFFWPGVQRVLRSLIQQQYAAWYSAVRQGRLSLSPLPFDDYLPAELSELDSRIQFPAWFYFEPGKLYVEHGCQYDHYNAFENFVHPVLPDDEKLVALPSGSFFVRYLFNQIEQLHPFADNIRPLSRYVNWLITVKPLDGLQLILRNPRTILRFLWNFTRKQTQEGMRSLRQGVLHPTKQHKAPLPLEPERRQKIKDLAKKLQKEGSRFGSRSTRQTILGVVLRLLCAALLVLALRFFVEANYLWLAITLLGAGASYAGALVLSQSINQVESYVTLPDVALDVGRILNQPNPAGQTAEVPFLLFGHDHYATLEELKVERGGERSFRQWYVNTGSWLPAFSETDRLSRGDTQLAFFRWIPDLFDQQQDLPELLEWQMHAQQPQKIRLLEPSK